MKTSKSDGAWNSPAFIECDRPPLVRSMNCLWLWGGGSWENWVRSWIGLSAKGPFFPIGRADGSSPVHRAGRCCHQTLQAGCKNTHTNTDTLTFLSVLYTQTEMCTHTHTSPNRKCRSLTLNPFISLFRSFCVILISSSCHLMQHFLWVGNGLV